MCKKKRYCNREKDECIRDKIKVINRYGTYKTLSSCCGHDKYDETIVVMDKLTTQVTEYNSQIHLGWGKRKCNRYYKKDKEGHYYIPEVNDIRPTGYRISASV